jgi:co-chaperonin GroES (HSP10)
MLTQKEWNERLIRNFRLLDVDDSLQILETPFFPLGGENLTIFIEKSENGYIISDRGQTFGTIFVLYGKSENDLNDDQKEFVKTVIEGTKIVYEPNKGFQMKINDKKDLVASCFDFMSCLIPIHYSLILERNEN